MALLQVVEANRRLCAAVRPPGAEEAPLAEALGRRLAAPLRRRTDQPPFTRSRVDGYAVGMMEDGGTYPRTLQVTGVVLAGESPPEQVPAGEALRVMTGAPLPPEVVAVVPFEEVPEGEAAAPGTRVTLRESPVPGTNVIPAGWEGARGSALLPEGALLGPVELGLLAAAGETAVRVRRRPRVAVLATGTELVPAGEPLSPGHIYASNLQLLEGLVASWGGRPTLAPPVPDRREAVRAAVENAVDGTELVLVTGGVAGGDRDLSRRVLADLRWPLLLDGADFHPGGRCAVAAPDGGPLVFFLSGGPGACLTAAILLVVPVLRTLAGGDGQPTRQAALASCPAKFASGVPSGRGRTRAVPVRLALSGGRLLADPLPHRSGAPVIAPATGGVILQPLGGGGQGSGVELRGGLAAGDLVDVWPLVPGFPDGGA